MTMTWTLLRHGVLRTAAAAHLLLATAGLAGCGLTDVRNPTALDEDDVGNTTGADLMRRNALRLFHPAAADAAFWSGLLADEFYFPPRVIPASGPVDEAYALVDQRAADGLAADRLSMLAQPYRGWHGARHAATLALRQLEAHAAEPQRSAHMGQMFAVRGYAVLRLGEDFCPGFPVHELHGDTPVYGGPLSTQQVLERALADLDSAVVLAADSARILDFARVVRARALLGLGRVAEAAAAVMDVPTGYVMSTDPVFFSTLFLDLRGSVADREGSNGVDFVSAADPRLRTTGIAPAPDGTPRYRPDKYPSSSVSLVLASGIEARLIEAEAALAADGAWLTILNDLRATQVSPAIAPLTDPGTPEARVDLLFRERAFWLFGTGHRLSDLRRLVRQYQRAPETVFPTGSHVTGVYGTATSLPFSPELERPFSPGVTGCTSL
jgi:starch-binding outer membrane protein, SusD/RagB family